MKPVPNRKLGDPIPPRLILTPQGTLKMVDGSDPADYLKAVFRSWGADGDIQVCICPREQTEHMEQQAFLFHAFSA